MRAEEGIQIQEKLIKFLRASASSPEKRAARGHITRGITVRESQYASPCLITALLPLLKLVAGDPPGANVVVGDVVPIAAVISAIV